MDLNNVSDCAAVVQRTFHLELNYHIKGKEVCALVGFTRGEVIHAQLSQNQDNQDTLGKIHTCESHPIYIGAVE